MAKLVVPLFDSFRNQLNAYAKTGVHGQVGGILNISTVEFDVSGKSQEKQGASGHKMPKFKPFQDYAEQREKQDLENQLKEVLGYVPKLKPNQKLTPDLANELIEEHKLRLDEIAQRNKIKGPEKG